VTLGSVPVPTLDSGSSQAESRMGSGCLPEDAKFGSSHLGAGVSSGTVRVLVRGLWPRRAEEQVPGRKFFRSFL
jgi:hypothetical protein